MNTSKHVQTVMNGTIHALKAVLPVAVDVKSPSIVSQPFEQQEMGVLVGMIGDLKGRIILDSMTSTFSGIGASMFGMPLEGEMLESFTGELGNMIAGNLCTYTAQQDLELDITPPTVLVGHTKLYGFEHAFRLPVEIADIGPMTIIVTIDEEQ